MRRKRTQRVMKRVLVGLCGMILAGCTTGRSVEPGRNVRHRPEGAVVRWTFEEGLRGRFPRGWSIRETNPTSALATWTILIDETAPTPRQVLALTRTQNYDGTYNLAVAETSAFKDLCLTVAAKAISGEEDQGGGPIWRCRDENNYYICRFNPLEGNYRVYKVEDGRRRQLQSAQVMTQADRWYTVRVTMIGDEIVCYLDGRELLHVRDGTFPNAGMVGLWTKADAATSFDNLEVHSLDEQ